MRNEPQQKHEPQQKQCSVILNNRMSGFLIGCWGSFLTPTYNCDCAADMTVNPEDVSADDAAAFPGVTVVVPDEPECLKGDVNEIPVQTLFHGDNQVNQNNHVNHSSDSGVSLRVCHQIAQSCQSFNQTNHDSDRIFRSAARFSFSSNTARTGILKPSIASLLISPVRTFRDSS